MKRHALLSRVYTFSGGQQSIVPLCVYEGEGETEEVAESAALAEAEKAGDDWDRSFAEMCREFRLATFTGGDQVGVDPNKGIPWVARMLGIEEIGHARKLVEVKDGGPEIVKPTSSGLIIPS